MAINRRTFLTTAATAGAVALLPATIRAKMNPDGLFPAAPNFFTSPRASVIVSGGKITLNEKFILPVRAAHQMHFGSQKKILLVLHATIPAERDLMEKRLQKMFAEDHFEAESLHHWEGAEALRRIASAEAIFVSGGETYLLLRTLIETGQLKAIRQRVLAGVPYHGVSAGANLAGPVIGCSNDFPVVDVPSRAGFGIFPAVVNPHHPVLGTPEFEERQRKVKGYARINPGETILGLGNGSVARLHAGKVSLVHGPGYLYRDATFRDLADGEILELSAMVKKR